jgi:hypothetical protein
MQVDRLDHFVLTVRDIDETIGFYQMVIGMAAVTFGAGRKALTFGQSKINLHPADAPIVPHANHPVPGSAALPLSSTLAACPLNSPCQPSILKLMVIPVEKLTEEMLSLPSDARALLADRLVESLDPINDESIRALWVAEAIRRRDEVRSGAVTAIPAEDVLAEARNLIKK